MYLPELGAVVESFYELKDVFDTGCFSEQRDSLFIERLRLLEYVLFFREEEQVALRGYLLALAYVLYSIRFVITE